MSNTIDGLTEKYKISLNNYFNSAKESTLKDSYELGRKALSEGFGILDIISVHGEVFREALLDASAIEECVHLAKQASDFLIECLSLFEMTHRGFKEANISLKKLNEDLKQKTNDLEFANKELETFSYSVSHDLRAPLRHISGFVELLQRNAAPVLDETNTRYLNNIYNSTKHMGNLIDDLLAFSRVGRFEMKKTEIDISQLVNDVLKEFTEETNNRKIYWKITDLPKVFGDQSMIRLVFTNLISNAIKFTRKSKQPEIEIGCKDNGNEYVFFIKDNGVGFEMEYVDKLFGIFQRLHRQDEFEGTGIGLASVCRIINRHSGQTWAEGEVNKGATFYFSLSKN